MLNLVACVVLVVFNALIGVWPMVAMNVALCGINLVFIRRLLLERHDPTAYDVLEVGADDAYLRHVLRLHRDDIGRFFPEFEPDSVAHGRTAFLVQHRDETVGVVVVRDAGDGVAQVELDYVTRRYRDFSPGEFVYRESTLFRDRGFRTVVAPRQMIAPYYDRIGFRGDEAAYVLDVS